MTPLFLYSNGPRGDVLFCRAVYRAAAASGHFDLVLGACRDDARLLADLQGPRCRIVAAEFDNTPHGALADLDHLRPEGWPGFEVWLGGNDPKPTYQWPDVVAAFDEDLARLGLPPLLAGHEDDVPMLDFALPVELPPLRRPSIWLETERTRDERCHFVFDGARLVEALPDFDFLCTAPLAFAHDRLVPVAHLDPIARSKLSEQCAVLVGRTMDPFVLTMTEANRFKPKALCGYDARVCAQAWDYPGNPLELLGTMDDLVDFLVANADPQPAAPALAAR